MGHLDKQDVYIVPNAMFVCISNTAIGDIVNLGTLCHKGDHIEGTAVPTDVFSVLLLWLLTYTYVASYPT